MAMDARTKLASWNPNAAHLIWQRLDPAGPSKVDQVSSWLAGVLRSPPALQRQRRC
jgi:hypothetical protein